MQNDIFNSKQKLGPDAYMSCHIWGQMASNNYSQRCCPLSLLLVAHYYNTQCIQLRKAQIMALLLPLHSLPCHRVSLIPLTMSVTASAKAWFSVMFVCMYRMLQKKVNCLHARMTTVGVGGIDKNSTSVFFWKNIVVLLHTYYWSSWLASSSQ